MIIFINCNNRCVMFWDLRPLPTRHQPPTRTTTTTNDDNPYHYLDLVWKPFYKVRQS